MLIRVHLRFCFPLVIVAAISPWGIYANTAFPLARSNSARQFSIVTEKGAIQVLPHSPSHPENTATRLAHPATKAANYEATLVARNRFPLDEFPPAAVPKPQRKNRSRPPHKEWRHSCRHLLYTSAMTPSFRNRKSVTRERPSPLISATTSANPRLGQSQQRRRTQGQASPEAQPSPFDPRTILQNFLQTISFFHPKFRSWKTDDARKCVM